MTFARILVPLDGSRLAEAVMPAARSLAETLGARLLLLHVVEREPPRAVHGEPHLATAADAHSYLETHADVLRRDGIAVESHVHERPVGEVAHAIDAHAHEFAADVIAMCAHGRSNLRTRVVGSIAERLLRAGSVPIVLRTVHAPGDVAFRLRRVLVPLDFGHDVDTAVAAARTLAKPYGASVTLLGAVEAPAATTARLLPGTAARLTAYETAEIARRLTDLAERLRVDLGEVQALVSDARPADAILEVRDALEADLIVLVTDAHGGPSSWFDPPAAQRLLQRPDLTLLLIREL
jgi:nucleotide-binding universal stress UspA family protein